MAKLAAIDLGSSRTGFVGMSEATAIYFGIAVSDADTTLVSKSRSAYTRQKYADIGDTTGESVSVKAAAWQGVPSRSGDRGSGQSIRVPSKLTTQKGSVRFATMNFPSNATQGAISSFLFEECDVAKRPDFFINERGVKNPVLKALAGDINPGNTPDPTP